MTSTAAMPMPAFAPRPASHSLARTKAAAAPIPVALLCLCFLAPTELSLFLADLRLPPHRIVLLALTPIALYKLCTLPSIRFRLFDALFITYNIWTVIVYSHHTGESGFIYGGSVALESLGGYLVARVWIRDIDTFFASLKFLFFCIMGAAIIALPDALLGGTFTHDILQSLTGYAHPRGLEKRFLLTRAYATFDHPIHYGAFCAALFSLYWYAEPRTVVRYKRAALIAGATFLSVSSAAILCVALQALMLIWDKVTRSTKLRVHLTIGLIVIAYIAASFVTSRPVLQIVVTSTAFDPWTAFYRLLIWEYGLINVWDNVLMGIGQVEWVRPQWMVSSTVDSFWLATTMRCGIPTFLLLAFAIVLIGRSVVKRGIGSRDKELRRIAMGWMVSLISLCLIGATVHYWNVLHTYFFFCIGLGGWIADPVRQKLKRPRRTEAQARRKASGYRPNLGTPLPA